MSIIGVFHMVVSLIEYLFCKVSPPKDESKDVEEGKKRNKVGDGFATKKRVEELEEEVKEGKRNHQQTQERDRQLREEVKELRRDIKNILRAVEAKPKTNMAGIVFAQIYQVPLTYCVKVLLFF